MNSVLLVKNLWLRLMPPHVIALNNALISDACTFKKLIIWQFILLRGCRVCRSNVKMGWELRNVFLSVEVTWASSRTEIQDWGSVTLWTSVTGPTLATMWQEKCSQAPHTAQYLGQHPASQQFPLCAPWTSSVTFSELWTHSPHPWHGIKMDHQESKWNHTCENCIK